jgi:hypothetical protein
VTTTDPPIRGDHKSTWLAIATILFGLAVVTIVVGFMVAAY